jgi:hypothetical protein
MTEPMMQMCERELFEIAKEINHHHGLPWTDPRTGKTYKPPKHVISGRKDSEMKNLRKIAVPNSKQRKAFMQIQKEIVKMYGQLERLENTWLRLNLLLN